MRADETVAPPEAFPFGAYAAVVEVDTELGEVTVLKLVAVDDYGVVVIPLIVDGQGYGSTVGAVVQVLCGSARVRRGGFVGWIFAQGQFG